jgi:transposase
MDSVGIDLHRKRSHVAAVAEDGSELLSRRVANDPELMLELLAEIDGESKIALEATYGWEWLAGLLEEAGYELHLAHPLRTCAIAAARVKTDAVDARTLAHLLRADLLPEAYVASRELRDLRELLRHRIALTQMRSALKNRVHALIAKHGVQHAHADLFGRGGREFLAALELREPPRRRLERLLSLICDFDREIDATTREIDALAKRDDRVDVLTQIRGVGRYTAMLVIAEVGDVDRFPSARKLCAWAGLTPTVRSSDGKARLGHITRQGSRPLRWALVEAAQKNTTGGGPLRETFERIAKRRGARSRRWRSPARSSPSATTACATERSVAWLGAADRTRQYSWRPAHDRRPPDCVAGGGRDAAARASSLFVMASHANGRPPT